MENNQPSYIKTDDNKVINEIHIRWIRKMSDCLEVCTKANGCHVRNTHRICKLNNPYTYNKLNKFFEESNN